MGASQKLQEFLKNEDVNFQESHHDQPVFTALETAGIEHIPGKQFVKSIILNADDKKILCVLPSTHLIDFDKLKKVAKAKNLSLASEKEIGEIFPEYEIGAAPPFDQFHNIQTFADKSLQDNDIIAFNAGTHTDIIKISLQDFLKLANPVIADFTQHI